MQRTMIIWLATAATLGAAPAAAQNATVEANTVAANNVVVGDATNMAAPVNGVAPAPAPAPAPATTATPPTTGDEGYVTGHKSGGFPWGLIGLVGLVGLLGRRRRTE
jgi:MYXO-CTERM domain-containing protein